MKKLAMIFMVLLVFPAPALAQEGADEINGAFRLKLDGEVPPNYSFYVEANVGSGHGPICTTDIELAGKIYPDCSGGGAINELPFVATAGQIIEYRILGAQGNELSQFVIARGSVEAAEGMTIDGFYAFPGESAAQYAGEADVASGAASAMAEDQYVDSTGEPAIRGVPADLRADAGVWPSGATSSVAPDGEVQTTELALLPDTGGIPVLLAAGATALLGAAGFLARRIVTP